MIILPSGGTPFVQNPVLGRVLDYRVTLVAWGGHGGAWGWVPTTVVMGSLTKSTTAATQRITRNNRLTRAQQLHLRRITRKYRLRQRRLAGKLLLQRLILRCAVRRAGLVVDNGHFSEDLTFSKQRQRLRSPLYTNLAFNDTMHRISFFGRLGRSVHLAHTEPPPPSSANRMKSSCEKWENKLISAGLEFDAISFDYPLQTVLRPDATLAPPRTKRVESSSPIQHLRLKRSIRLLNAGDSARQMYRLFAYGTVDRTTQRNFLYPDTLEFEVLVSRF